MSSFADDLRNRLLEGLPPRVQGMAEGIVLEWEQAVVAVPELERLAAEDVGGLAELPPAEREDALRRRWTRLHDIPEFEMRGRAARRVASVGHTAAAR